MGIPVREEPVYEPTPNTCWVSGRMPEWVWVSVSGVQKGDIWERRHGKPQDLRLKLWRVNIELYENRNPDYEYGYWLSNPRVTIIDIRTKERGRLLSHTALPGCTTLCPNQQQSPAYNQFYGGVAEIWASSESFGGGYNADIVKDIVAPDDKTYFEPARPDNDIRIARYARHRDGTRVYIRRTN